MVFEVYMHGRVSPYYLTKDEEDAKRTAMFHGANFGYRVYTKKAWQIDVRESNDSGLDAKYTLTELFISKAAAENYAILQKFQNYTVKPVEENNDGK